MSFFWKKISKKYAGQKSGVLCPQVKSQLVDCAWLVLFVTLASLLVNVSIRVDVMYYGTTLGESSLTESLQVAILLVVSAMFFKLSQAKEDVRHAALLICGFFLVLAIRELDHWLDMIIHGFWFYPALLVTVFALSQAYKGGISTLEEMALVLKSSYGKLMIVGVVLLVVFSRLYGMGSFWREAMGDNYIRSVKNISEEGIELLCYTLIFWASIQIYRKLMSQDKKSAIE